MKCNALIALLIAAGILLGGCQMPQAEIPDPTVDPSPVQTAEPGDPHLRDVNTLYTDDLFSVVTMYLTVRQGNPSDGTDHTWQEVNSYSAYYYEDLGIDRYKVSALLQVGDEDGPLPGMVGYGEVLPNATVQVRGQTSSRNAQKNYKIELLDGSGKWNGQRTIALNKHMGDGMRFRNKLCFDLLSEIPQLMSLRTQFVHLYVRDLTGDDPEHFVDYGIYTQVEQLNKSALKAHGLDKNGYLYKVNSCEFYEYDELKPVSDPGYDEQAFSHMLESKGRSDHTRLLEMIRAVNDLSLSDDAVLDRYFDRENLAYWMAFMLLMGNTDTQNRNFYIYSPLNGEKWYIYPWDNDASLMQKELSIKKRVDFGDWERGITNYWGNRIFRRALKSESFRAELDAAVEDLLQNYLTEEKLQSRIDGYAAVVKPYLYSLPDMLHQPLTPEEYEDVKACLMDEIQENYALYRHSLLCPMPFYVGMPEPDPDGFTFLWDTAASLNGEDITYHVILARDWEYNDVIFEKDGLSVPTVHYDGTLEPGQYFLHVCAENESGCSINCFDYYTTAESSNVYGTYCFFIEEDGAIHAYEPTEGDR